ncbi:hypothetical protein ACLBOM_13325 [Escherichia coli]
MKCGIGDDDYNGQKAFVDSICDFKNKTNSHVILVTHWRKRRQRRKTNRENGRKRLWSDNRPDRQPFHHMA